MTEDIDNRRPKADERDEGRRLEFTVVELETAAVDADAEQIVFTRSTSTSCSTS